MASTIRNVPDELLVEILGKLPKKDLKKARLACTLWSTAGAKWLFQRVYFAPRKAAMKTLTDIAANPVFARNVKEMIYDGRLFLPELGTFVSYWAAFCDRVEEEFDTYEDHTRNARGVADDEFANEVYQDSIWNMKSIGAGEYMESVNANDCKEFHENVVNSLVRYVRLLDQQESIFKKGKDFKALCEALKSFRNISKVSALADFDHCSNYRLGAYIEDEWYNSQANLQFGLTVPPSRWCRKRRSQDGEQSDQEEHIKWDVRGVQNLFRAISTHCPSLRELRIGTTRSKAPMTVSQLSVADTEKFCTTFHCLRTLQIHPYYVTDTDTGPEFAKQHHCLELLLRQAKELRILSSSRWFLDEDEESEESDSGHEHLVLSKRTDFGMFVEKPWRQLTKLILEEARVKASDLMSIVRANKGSLRDLDLYAIFLFGKEGWVIFGKEMGQILTLHSICASGLSDDTIKPMVYGWPRGEQGVEFVRDMMQWALPDRLEIEESYGMTTGKLKVGPS